MELKNSNVDTNQKWNQIYSHYIGYYRMYWRVGWAGSFFPECDGFLLEKEKKELFQLCKIIEEKWPDGCDELMKKDLSFYPEIVSHRYLLETETENLHLLVLCDITFGNQDYPIRIYIYRK